MAKLAIKGHKTRGKEVIAILEMLGGKMRDTYNGDAGGCVYIIDEGGAIDWRHHYDNYTVYSLEEFLEKFPYKVGDKVSSRYLKNYRIEKMEWEDTNNRVIYKLQGMGWYSVRELQPYKEETIEESIDKTNKVIFEANAQSCDIMNDIIKEDMETITIDDFKANTKEWLIDKLESMSKANALQTISNIYDELHKSQYPKTYEECCKVLGYSGNYNMILTTDVDNKLFNALYRLKICRDAYWKIAGEQMGLGKPWEPDFGNENEYKYGLFRLRNIIYKDATCINPVLLIFPTAEMRDAFYENFKDLIEQCKEFL